MSNLVQYTSFSTEDAKSERDEVAKSGSTIAKLKNGKNVLRFLPGVQGRKWAVRVQQHYIDLGGNKSASFACPRLMAGKFCPGCAFADKLRGTGSSADAQKAKDYMPNMQAFANFIDRADPEAGPQTGRFPKGVYDNMCALAESEDVGGDFTRPTDQGYDLIIEKTGTGLDTRYKVLPARVQTALADDVQVMNDWITAAPDLSRFAVVHTAEEIEAMLRGGSTGGSASGGNGAERSPRRRTAADDMGGGA